MKAGKKLAVAVNPVPEGSHAITPVLTVRGADRAIEYYKKAFGAELIGRFPGPDGKRVMHAELRIGDSKFFVGDEFPEMGCRSPEALGGSPSGWYLYVRDADETVRKAVEAGGAVKRPVEDMFWGDRCGTVGDPFGYDWTVATHQEDVSEEELRRRHGDFLKTMKPGGC